MLTQKEKEINAMIQLLDDEDKEIIELVSHKILSLGESVIPKLEDAWEQSIDLKFQKKIEDLIHQIQFQSILTELKKWDASSDNLLDGVLLLAKYQYPEIDFTTTKNILEKVIKDCNTEIRQEQSLMHKIRVINHILFDVYGLIGDRNFAESLDSNFIHKVLENKKGNPLLLSVIYMIVTNALKIPIYGVNLPEHFIVAYAENPKDVKFYINPFTKGSIFSKREIDAFLTQLQVEKKEEYYLPCSNNSILIRIINSMMIAYKTKGYHHKLEELDLMKKIIYQNEKDN